MNTNVLRAVFKRNFYNYFANPTGYVFICVFVMLSGFAAFWPNEFFARNVANLDQLSYGALGFGFPLIMLVFIPAITMGVWADERRQGTDELLLTIPATDLDVVLGKYLAALAIFTASLLFSLVCNYLVLNNLAYSEPGFPLLPVIDAGLFLSTYLGYWLIGVAMLAVGMVASFLTSNLTVAYILGVLLNAPLVLAVNADAIFHRPAAIGVKQWSLIEQFRDFGRGILSLSGFAYFGMIVAVMLYLSMVFIGRRHWRDSQGPLHYLVRFLALVVTVVCASLFFRSHDLRRDVTSEKLSTLSPATIKLLDELEPKRLVQIEAFVSPEVPESFVPTRMNLINMLEEIRARGGNKVQVRINKTEQYSEEAERARRRYNITPKHIVTQVRGVMQPDDIFLGVAFSSGLEKVVVPFIDRGLSPEYELVRSLATVTQQKRKRLGVLTTEAPLFSKFDPSTMSGGGDWPIIEELKKQYDVVQVDPAQPISEKYDVLLAVQPSSLAPEQLDNFIAAVRRGQPTAIFEDPFPAFAMSVPGTKAPRRPPGGMQAMMMGMRNIPKGDTSKLWDMLGIRFSGDQRDPGEQLVYQNYNPYPKLRAYHEEFPEFVFIDKDAGNKQAFTNDSPIASKLQRMLFPFPGYIAKLNSSDMQFAPLVETGDKTGTVRFDDMMEMSPFGMGGGINRSRRHLPANAPFVLAAEIRGKPRPAPRMAEEKPAPAADAKQAPAENKSAEPAKSEPAKSEPAKSDPTAKPADAADPKPAADAAAKPADEPAAKSTEEPAAKATDKPEAKMSEAPAKEVTETPAAEPSVPEIAEPVVPHSGPAAKGPDAIPAPQVTEKPAEDGDIHVIVVSDIDMLHQAFFDIRAQGEPTEGGINYDFDNVTFILNTLDALAGDESLVEIRKRRATRQTLAKIEQQTKAESVETEASIKKLQDAYDKTIAEESKKFNDSIRELEDQFRKQSIDPNELINRIGLAKEAGQKRMDAKKEQLKQEMDSEINQIRNTRTFQMQQVETRYKLWAILLPPILPLLIGLGVFLTRRSQEREGVSKTRLRS